MITILKSFKDFEGYETNTKLLATTDTIQKAEEYIEELKKTDPPTLCHCGEHNDFEYIVKVVPEI